MWWKSFFTMIHVQAHGDPIECDPKSTSQMLAYATRVSHKLKEFIWTQLKLGYIVKKIYDKHKEIWWAQANEGE
jgi:hypothetical protein